MRSALRTTATVLGLLTLAVLVNLVWPTRTDIRVFDSDRVARLDTDMWRSYYDRKPVALFFQAAHLLREQFHMTLARSFVTAYRAADAAFAFKRGQSRADYERALPQLRRYFADIRAISTTPFDVQEAARTELEWWIVHRQRQAHAPGDLSRALAVAAGVLYGTEPGILAGYGDERALAMTIRDDRQAAGGVSEADWAAIDDHLRVSWAGLQSAVSATAPAAASSGPSWRVHAIRYATIRDFPVSALVTGADTSRRLDIAMMCWLMQGPGGRRVLLDAGFYRRKFVDAWKPADFVKPSDAVLRAGVPADSVTDVVISHVHWDHLDGADLFPNARVWIQREEYEYYVGKDGLPAHAAIDTVDAAMLARLKKAGRVQLVEGDAKEILPGITAYTGGKHTYASQYLGVRTAVGTVVLASDNMYLYENLEKHAPIAQTLDSVSNLAAQERMKKLASSARLIVPGHDPAVFTRFRAVKPGVAAIE